MWSLWYAHGQMNTLLQSIWAGHEWIFSGIGVAILFGIGAVIRRWWTRLHTKAPQPPSVVQPLVSTIELLKPPIQDRMTFRENVYWKPKGDGLEGPYCPKCVVADNRAAPMEDRKYIWKCLVCKETVRKINYSPPAPPRPPDDRDPVTGY